MPTIYYNGTAIEYVLTRKAVKNLNLRIKPDGTVAVSAGRGVPISFIESFVLSRAEYILRAREKSAARQRASVMPERYTTGERITLLGCAVPLTVEAADRDEVFFSSAGVLLRTRYPDDTDKKRKLMERELTKLCLRAFTEVTRDMYGKFAACGFPFPEIKVRRMTSRWGSCMYAKGSITLNTRLIEAPVECLEYVALHELAHFVHHDHSARFHALVGSLMPDYRRRKELLEESVAIR